MKLTYRDRIILLIVLSIAILAIGFFALIRPRINDIKESDARLTQVKGKWEDIEKEINKIPGLQKKINETYEESKKISKNFVPVKNYAYEVDQYMQQYADECNVIIQTMEATDLQEMPLEYYYTNYVLLEGTMFEKADINGNYKAGFDKTFNSDLTLAERNVETVLGQQYGIEVIGSKEEIWNYLKKIADISEAVVITDVEIDDYYFGMDPNDPRELTWSEPNDKGVKKPLNALTPDEGYSRCTINIDLYSVYEMDKPVVE
ncbi:MAG: hypothetical protein IKI94_04725 [Ruminococcus sp.]|nr:hypothetical protein [Ruminococcus sp.]